MVGFKTGWDADKVDTSDSYSVMPAGDYEVMVKDSEMKSTKAGTGQYIKFTYEVVSPEEYKGRLVFDNMNIDNPNQQAVDIAMKQLAKLCKAVGEPRATDSSQLHNKFFTAVLKVRKSDEYGDQNEVKDYLPSTGGQKATPSWNK